MLNGYSDAASVDTTTATVSVFILNMILHPEVQAKGRAEVLRVVGTERLPTLAECVLRP